MEVVASLEESDYFTSMKPGNQFIFLDCLEHFSLTFLFACPFFLLFMMQEG